MKIVDRKIEWEFTFISMMLKKNSFNKDFERARASNYR
jgi:hypothetical protein